MRLFERFRTPQRESAGQARQRLQSIIARDRLDQRGRPHYLPALQHDLLSVIGRYVPVDQDRVKINFNRRASQEVLELQVVLH